MLDVILYQHMAKGYYEGARIMRDAGYFSHAIRLQNEASAAAYTARNLLDITPALKKSLYGNDSRCTSA